MPLKSSDGCLLYGFMCIVLWALVPLMPFLKSSTVDLIQTDLLIGARYLFMASFTFYAIEKLFGRLHTRLKQ